MIWRPMLPCGPVNCSKSSINDELEACAHTRKVEQEHSKTECGKPKTPQIVVGKGRNLGKKPLHLVREREIRKPLDYQNQSEDAQKIVEIHLRL
jgi:hypothetical protein